MQESIQFRFEEIAAAMGGEALAGAGSRDQSAIGVSIDSRSVKPGELFFCIRGANNDGHRFIEQALQCGAAAIVADHEAVAAGLVDRSRILSVSSLFLVEDTTRALQGLASFHRGRLQGRIVAVTGSSGKTSTRDMLFSLAERIQGKEGPFATKGNLNNHWGLPLSLLSVRPSQNPVILELGMNHAGEIDLLTRIARPHAAVITSVSAAHFEFFHSVEEIARAKLEIASGLPAGAPLLYNASSPGVDLALARAKELALQPVFFAMDPDPALVRRLEASGAELSIGTNLRVDARGISFQWEGRSVENGAFFHPVMGWNLLAALTILSRLGYETDRLVAEALHVTPATPRRFQVRRKERPGSNPLLLVDDSYNANPDSFEKAIRALREILPSGRLALFAGEMAELGPELGPESHRRIGQAAAEEGYTLLAASGGEGADTMARAYREAMPQGRALRESSPERLLEEVRKTIEIDRDLDGILVKGSRSARMDLVSDALKVEGYV